MSDHNALDPPLHDEAQDAIESFAQTLKSLYKNDEQQRIKEAALWAEKEHRLQQRASGDPYILHPLAVAELLAKMGLDAPGVIAGLLHDILEDTDVTRKNMRETFGHEVELLVNGVTKIDILKVKDRSVQGSETIRKMFLAMTKDIRVILIKLADRYHNMQTISFLAEEKQRRIATECLDIYAPLAGKLGVYWLKSDLEDLSLKCLDHESYNTIKAFVDQKKKERGAYLRESQEDIYRIAAQHGLRVKVATRAKHFYSIYDKMHSKGRDLESIFDLLGIRILCQTTTDCYAIMGLIHQLWKPLSGRFKDYIAIPKENNYQSLHTTVVGKGGRLLEIQIRTHPMHEIAEYGVAAHWLYKERKGTKVNLSELAFVNRLKYWNRQKCNYQDFFIALKRDLLQNSIFLFTPVGDIIELPQGATGIDFAYHIHTEVGHHCVGIRVDGNITPLTKPLETTKTVCVLTATTAHPHVNWLRHVRTTRARSKIRAWLRQHDPSVVIEKNIVARKRVELSPKEKAPNTKTKERDEKALRAGDNNRRIDSSRVEISIAKEKHLMIRIARCCQPTMGDRIIGFVSRGRGIIVHREDCSNLSQINEFQERKIDVEWEIISTNLVEHFRIQASFQTNLFAKVEGAIQKYRGHLISGSLNETDRGDLEGLFVVEIDKQEAMKQVLKSIRAIPSVHNVHRVEQAPSWN